MRNNHYNKNLKLKARALRKDPTRAEVTLWHEVLQGRRCMGYRFLRQRPIENFIVDFFSKELKLVIEVDGYTHQFEEVLEKDRFKDQRLSELGYSVLRFTDDEVLNDLNNVVRTLENFILDFEESLKEQDASPPSPLEGEIGLSIKEKSVEYRAKNSSLDYEESLKEQDVSPPLSPSRGKLPEEQFSKHPMRGSTAPNSPLRGLGGENNTPE